MNKPVYTAGMTVVAAVVVGLSFGTFGLWGCGESKGNGKTADFGKDTTLYVGNVPIAMVFVHGGTFTMGCTSEQGEDCYSKEWTLERPAHSVTLNGFYIAKYETTENLWREIMGEEGSYYHYAGWDSLPVTYVSWNEVQDFITKLNRRTGMEYRLPTEAEWEYAARGGSKSNWYKYSGSNNIDDVAWYDGNTESFRVGEILYYDGKMKNLSTGEILWQPGRLLGDGRRVTPERYVQFVGTKQPNELGIHDMSGNVGEWVNDWYGPYTASSETNPAGPLSANDYQGTVRVVRGGHWEASAWWSRVSCRYEDSPHIGSIYTGFRLAHQITKGKI